MASAPATCDAPLTFAPYGTGAGDSILTSSTTITSNIPYAAFDERVLSGFDLTLEPANTRGGYLEVRAVEAVLFKYFIYASFTEYDSGKGTVYYRVSTSGSDLNTVGTLIGQGYVPSWVFVQTFVCVETGGLENTFQVILATDGCQTFVIVNYHIINGVQMYEDQFFIEDADGHIYVIGNYSVADLTDTTNALSDGQWIYDITSSSPTALPPTASLCLDLCAECGGCFYTWNSALRITEAASCGKAEKCIRNVNPKRERILNPRQTTRKIRRIRRLRHCCYNFKTNPATALSRSRPCFRVRGWTN